jgi:hypothetical protein
LLAWEQDLLVHCWAQLEQHAQGLLQVLLALRSCCCHEQRLHVLHQVLPLALSVLSCPCRTRL